MACQCTASSPYNAAPLSEKWRSLASQVSNKLTVPPRTHLFSHRCVFTHPFRFTIYLFFQKVVFVDGPVGPLSWKERCRQDHRCGHHDNCKSLQVLHNHQKKKVVCQECWDAMSRWVCCTLHVTFILSSLRETMTPQGGRHQKRTKGYKFFPLDSRFTFIW